MCHSFKCLPELFVLNYLFLPGSKGPQLTPIQGKCKIDANCIIRTFKLSSFSLYSIYFSYRLFAKCWSRSQKSWRSYKIFSNLFNFGVQSFHTRDDSVKYFCDVAGWSWYPSSHSTRNSLIFFILNLKEHVLDWEATFDENVVWYIPVGGWSRPLIHLSILTNPI